MKIYDLHSGKVIPELPPRVEPGRYRLLEAATLNGVAELAVGDMLWSDGGTRCELQDAQGRCWRSAFMPISADESAAWELVDQGVMTVANLIKQAAADALPAPLMPESLAQLAQPTDFEMELERVLQAGHLHEISVRPRMTMRYDAEILPVSRAKRVATGALMRLASRSEDWHRRTLSGIEPARVLAEVSEDEWGIYENIVFARLLDQALRLLARRQRELRRLLERQAAALNLNQSEDLNHRLRNSLCTLWGQAWTQESRSHDLLQERLDTLKQLINCFKQLRFGPLYQAIARSARVPVALKSTNILLHDRHYRELRKVWQLAHKAETEVMAHPAEQIYQRIKQHRHHGAFVGLLIRHALAACKTLKREGTGFKFGTATLHVKEIHATEWTLTLQIPGPHTKTLTFAAAWSGIGHWETHCLNTQDCRQLIYCHGPFSSDDAQRDPGTGEDGVLNPLQFYAVERVKVQIERWLYQDLVHRYPPTISSMPEILVAKLLEHDPGAFFRNGKGLSVLRSPMSPLSPNQLAVWSQASHANKTSQDQLVDALANAELRATCRACGVIATHSVRAERTNYWAECGCGRGYVWSITRPNGTGAQASFGFKNTELVEFRTTGSWVLQVNV